MLKMLVLIWCTGCGIENWKIPEKNNSQDESSPPTSPATECSCVTVNTAPTYSNCAELRFDYMTKMHASSVTDCFGDYQDTTRRQTQNNLGIQNFELLNAHLDKIYFSIANKIFSFSPAGREFAVLSQDQDPQTFAFIENEAMPLFKKTSGQITFGKDIFDTAKSTQVFLSQRNLFSIKSSQVLDFFQVMTENDCRNTFKISSNYVGNGVIRVRKTDIDTHVSSEFLTIGDLSGQKKILEQNSGYLVFEPIPTRFRYIPLPTTSRVLLLSLDFVPTKIFTLDGVTYDESRQWSNGASYRFTAQKGANADLQTNIYEYSSEKSTINKVEDPFLASIDFSKEDFGYNFVLGTTALSENKLFIQEAALNRSEYLLEKYWLDLVPIDPRQILAVTRNSNLIDKTLSLELFVHENKVLKKTASLYLKIEDDLVCSFGNLHFDPSSKIIFANITFCRDVPSISPGLTAIPTRLAVFALNSDKIEFVAFLNHDNVDTVVQLGDSYFSRSETWIIEHKLVSKNPVQLKSMRLH